MAVRARPLSEEVWTELDQVLTDKEQALFAQQSLAGQQHAYRVMRTLADNGQIDNNLLVAALLHDVGKSRLQYTEFDRIKVVLAQRFARNLAREWEAGRPNVWTRAFVVKARHPEWGAEALAEAGGSQMSVALVRRHQESPLDPAADEEENRLLALLQWADDRN